MDATTQIALGLLGLALLYCFNVYLNRTAQKAAPAITGTTLATGFTPASPVPEAFSFTGALRLAAERAADQILIAEHGKAQAASHAAAVAGLVAKTTPSPISDNGGTVPKSS